MQLINSPAKLVLPFATSGNRRVIPTASQIGITAGAASLTDGFPPLAQTPISAGGVPVSPLDMNGIFYELSAILRWANAGGGYPYDGTFANDSNVGGYPKGSRVMRSDGLGYWFNTSDNNVTDPESVGAVAAGWVPDFTTGATAVTMTGSNVTLAALEYGKPIIIISGLLTANLNLIFPTIPSQWLIVNNTTGAFTITAKTASGTGVLVTQSATTDIYGDGINISAPSSGGLPFATTPQAVAGTDNATIITPLRMREGFNAAGSAPVYACRAWVNFDGTGTVSIRSSGNVSSITDNGVGDYTINFTTAMPDANYSMVVCAGPLSSGASAASSAAAGPHNAVPTTSACRVATFVSSTTASIDPFQVSVAIFR